MRSAACRRPHPFRSALAAFALLVPALALAAPAAGQGQPERSGAPQRQVVRSGAYEIAFASEPELPLINQPAWLQFTVRNLETGREVAIARLNVGIEDRAGKSVARQVAGGRLRHTFQATGPHTLRVVLQLADGAEVRGTFFIAAVAPARVTLAVWLRALQGVLPATWLTFVHVAAAVAWVGALLFVTAVIHPAALRRPDGAQLLEAAYRRFNPLIAGSLGLLVGTGFLRMGYHGFGVRNSLTLFLTTAYGFALLLKLLAFLAMLGLGLYVALVLVPRLQAAANPHPGEEARRLAVRVAWLTRLELLLGGVAFLLGTLFLQIHFVF